jgi:hypothetical protein
MPRPTDLAPATNAYVYHMPVLLEWVEKNRDFQPKFSLDQDFIWRSTLGSRPSLVTVHLIASVGTEQDCYMLHLSFTGDGAEEFRTNHQHALVEETAKVLDASNWRVLPFKGDEERKAQINHDGIYFTVMRPVAEEQTDESNPGSTELVD